MKNWTETEIDWLKVNYPDKGLKACCEHLGRSSPSVRQKASRLGLKQNRNSDFFRDWQLRAAQSKIGKRRPEQAKVMERNRKEGKLDLSSEARNKISKGMKEHIAKNGHPKGMKGKKHTPETLEKLSKALRDSWNSKTLEEQSAKTMKMLKTKEKRGNLVMERGKTTWKSGWREIGGVKKYYRSRWEANYARYLQWLLEKGEIQKWDHEPETFWFEKIKRGCRSYLPDFKVTENNGDIVWYEVKGWMDARSKTKLKRMAKYHPDINLQLIQKKEYREIERKLSSMILGWEL